MNVKVMTMLRVAASCAGVAGMVAAGLASAQATVVSGLGGTVHRALPPTASRSGATATAQAWRAVPMGAHHFYGTIASIKGSQLAIRLRNGRVQVADATAAIAHGDYSAPLFVGKTVAVDGAFNGSSFTISHIFRLTNLADLGADR
jgi:hypothetical protein